ncbi:MAG: glycosyltransferase family 4 protein [Fibrobacter sp.]|nr:glycosyltransferase family 4 protein [Fibrobacter sp.]
MKIVVVGLRGVPDVQGGIETHCEHLYPYLAKQGFDITIIGRKNFLPNVQQYDYQGCTVLPLAHPKATSLETIAHTFAAIFKAKQLKADVVHIHAIGPAIMTIWARILGLKVLVTHHGMDYNRQKWGLLARTILRTGEKMAAKYSHGVISISHAITAQIHRLNPRQKVHQIPNGVVLPAATTEDPPSAKIAQLGLTDKKYIFALGRFVPEKEFHTLISAWSALPPGSCELVIAGKPDHDSPYSQALLAQAEQAGAIMPGFVKGADLDHLFRHAAGFVIPSTHEGLPIAMLEAMSYNLPIVASDIEPHLEVKLDPSCYFKTQSVPELTEKLQALLKNPEKPQYRTLLADKYDWGKIATQTAQVYRGL